jgi:hypothetical protein
LELKEKMKNVSIGINRNACGVNLHGELDLVNFFLFTPINRLVAYIFYFTQHATPLVYTISAMVES